MGLLEAFGDRLQLLSAAAEMGHTSARTRVAAMIATGVDGVITDGGALEALGERPPVPVMLLDSPEGPSDLVRINFDLRSGAEALATHLLELGHRRIGYVQADRPTPTLALRHRVFARRVHAAGGAVLDTPSEITIEAASGTMLKRWSEWDSEGVTARLPSSRAGSRTQVSAGCSSAAVGRSSKEASAVRPGTETSSGSGLDEAVTSPAGRSGRCCLGRAVRRLSPTTCASTHPRRRRASCRVPRRGGRFPQACS